MWNFKNLFNKNKLGKNDNTDTSTNIKNSDVDNSIIDSNNLEVNTAGQTNIIKIDNKNFDLNKFTYELSEFKIEHNNLIDVLKECDDCKNSMRKVIQKNINSKNKAIEMHGKIFPLNELIGGIYDASKELKKISENENLIMSGLNFKKCSSHAELHKKIRNVVLKIKTYEEILNKISMHIK